VAAGPGAGEAPAPARGQGRHARAAVPDHRPCRRGLHRRRRRRPRRAGPPDQWLPRPPPATDPGRARAELIRRYLHRHGPSTPAAFAEWTLRGRADAGAAFALVERELVEVDTDAGRAFLLAADADALADPPAAEGVRLLPTQDPFLQQRDRATLLPDPSQRRRLWRPVGGPGLLLLDGRPAGLWRSQVRRGRLRVAVEPFGSLPAAAHAAVEAEAQRLAPFRGAATAEVAVSA
jgi:hypothetical protein